MRPDHRLVQQDGEMMSKPDKSDRTVPGPVRRGPPVWDQSEYREGIGVVRRPVAFPEDIADPTIPKATGVVELPFHVHWWEPFRTYDLDDQLDREAVYREVLQEGTPDDVRWFIEVDKLADMWDDIILPSHVRYVWEPWLREHGWLKPESDDKNT